MKYKQIVLSIFVFVIFNLFAFSPFSRPRPAPTAKPSPGLYGQSVDLVKLKEEEEERKKKTKKSKYVVTNENLDKIELPNKPYGVIKIGGKEAEKGAETAGGSTGTQNQTVIEDNSPSGSKADDSGAVDRQSSPTYWQDRVIKLLDAIDETDADIKNSQRELFQLNNDLQSEDIYQKRREIETKMAELKKHIPEAKQKLADLNKAMEDLEEQARKEKIPAGWLRVDRPEPEKKKQEGQSDRKQKG